MKHKNYRYHHTSHVTRHTSHHHKKHPQNAQQKPASAGGYFHTMFKSNNTQTGRGYFAMTVKFEC